MYCKECGKEIDDNAAFCIYCGKPTANAGAATYVIPDGNEDKRKKSSKNIIWIGIIVIIILVVLVFMFSAKGNVNNVTDTAAGTANTVTDTAGTTTNKAADTATSTAETSALNDIIGDWGMCLGIDSNTYASNFEEVSYFRVEAEGIMAIGGDMGSRFYAIGVDDITIQEENGIKYYTYSAEMYTTLLEQGGGSGRQVIGIRLYLDEVSGWLVCELNTLGDGFWQIVDAYKLMDISIEEKFDSLRPGGGYRTEGEIVEEAVEGKYFSTLEEALADEDFRNWFEYKTGKNSFLLDRTFEYNADGNNIIFDYKFREERSLDTIFMGYFSQDKMNDWMDEWSEMVDEQDGSNLFTVTVHCLSSDGKESAERTYVHETQIETLEEYYSDPARAYSVVYYENSRWCTGDFEGMETEGSLDVTGNDVVVTIQFKSLNSSLSQDFALLLYEYLESWDDQYMDKAGDLNSIVNERGACTYTIRFTDPNNVVFAEKTYVNETQPMEIETVTLEEYYSDPAHADAAVNQELRFWGYDGEFFSFACEEVNPKANIWGTGDVYNGLFDIFNGFEVEGWLDITGNDVVVTIQYKKLDSSFSQDFASLIYECIEVYSLDNTYTFRASDLDSIVNEPGACTYTLRFTDSSNTAIAERTYSNRQ